MSDIIDNREVKLLDTINKILENTERAKFAIGYFFLSGFEAIKDKLKDLKEVRLLIGNTTTRETLDQLAEGYRRLEVVERAMEERKYIRKSVLNEMIDNATENIKDSISLMDQTDGAQELVITLARLIEEKKVKVKVYTKGRLHSKAYIFDYREGRYEKGIAVVGSSNLTLHGLADNTELNVIVPGNDNHEKLSQWFNELWGDAKEFDENLLRELKRSWAMHILKPYDLYIKTLYHLVKDRIEGEEEMELLWEREFPPLADFQKVAVRQALHTLDNHGGVFVADVVGAGKTYIGTALLKYLSIRDKAIPLVICPPSLEKMWDEFCETYKVNARILSTGMLSQGEVDLLRDYKYRDRDLVLIDESHNFRHQDTERYRNLQPYLLNRKTILITATPRNTSAWDIYYQMKLFHQEDKTFLPIDPPDLREFFKKVDSKERRLPNLLRHVLIRRRRKDILDWYGKEDEEGRKYIPLNGKKGYFPHRELDTETYSIEETYQGFYQNIRSLIGKLKLCKYGLWNYVVEEKKNVKPYIDLERAGKNLRGLMRILLFKRLESSIGAFQETLKRLCRIHNAFIEALDEGIVPAGKEAQELLYDEDTVEEQALMENLEKVSRKYSAEDFELEELKKHISDDTKHFEKMYEYVKDITPEKDDKLRTLKEEVLDKKVPSKEKVLIFTQYSDTADYLYKNLGAGTNKELTKIDSKRPDGLQVVRRFAPKSNPPGLSDKEREIRILVSTDVLAEGLNLQDANYVVNYDLHWNPVRLIQRIGRIDRIRIGVAPDVVYAYNFLPETELEKNLGIHEKLRERIKEIHETIGEDAKILERNEQLNKEAMYAIYEKDTSILEKDEEDDLFPEIGRIEAFMLNLKKENPEYYQHIAQLPTGLRSSKFSDKKGFFTFCQAGNYQQLYLTDQKGSITTKDLAEILNVIKCDENEASANIPKNMNAVVQKIRRLFKRETEERVARQEVVVTLTPAQRYILNELRVLLREEDEEIKEKITLLEEIFRRELPRMVKKQLNIIKRNSIKGQGLLDRLTEIYSQFDLGRVLDTEKKSLEKPFPRIITSESLI